MKEQSITIAGVERVVRATKGEADWIFEIDGEEVAIREIDHNENETVLSIDGRRVVVPLVRNNSTLDFSLDGNTWRAEAATAGKRRGQEKAHSLSAPMPGSVLEIKVAVGDEVAKGATLMVLEAMKMEHQITAPWDGVVSTISCRTGEMVQPGVDLIEVDPLEKDSAEETS